MLWTSHNKTAQLPRLLGYQRDNYTNVPSEQWSYPNVLLFCVQCNALPSWNHSSLIPWCGSFIEYSSHNIQVFPWIFKASLVAQLVKNLPAMWETSVRSLGWEDPLDKGRATHSKYSGLENSMVCIVHGVAKSRTWPTDFHFTSSHNNTGWDLRPLLLCLHLDKHLLK